MISFNDVKMDNIGYSVNLDYFVEKCNASLYYKISLFDETIIDISVEEAIENKLPCWFILSHANTILSDNYYGRIVNGEYKIFTTSKGNIIRKYIKQKNITPEEQIIIDYYKLMSIV